MSRDHDLEAARLGLRDLGADLPLPRELRSGLLEIDIGADPDRDGETRTGVLDGVSWPELEPPRTLVQRLLAIPEHRHVHRRAAFRALPGMPAGTPAHPVSGSGATVAASYLLAVALTLAVGDPVAIGRKATAQLSVAAGEHVLEPAAMAGVSMQTDLSRRLSALRERLRPAGLFDEPLRLPTDSVQAWFRNAVASSAEAFGNLTDLFPSPDPETSDEPPATTQTQPGLGKNSARPPSGRKDSARPPSGRNERTSA